MKRAGFHPSIHPGVFLSIHSVNVAASWNGIKASFAQSGPITTITSITGFEGADRTAAPPPSHMHTRTRAGAFMHTSCCFISGAELSTPGKRRVQPQLQIDRLSSPTAPASFSPSAQRVFSPGYCSYCCSLDKKRAALKECQESCWAVTREQLLCQYLSHSSTSFVGYH